MSNSLFWREGVLYATITRASEGKSGPPITGKFSRAKVRHEREGSIAENFQRQKQPAAGERARPNSDRPPSYGKFSRTKVTADRPQIFPKIPEPQISRSDPPYGLIPRAKVAAFPFGISPREREPHTYLNFRFLCPSARSFLSLSQSVSFPEVPNVKCDFFNITCGLRFFIYWGAGR